MTKDFKEDGEFSLLALNDMRGILDINRLNLNLIMKARNIIDSYY
jgi:hypothetical protein